ncbi:DUF262 domain-containing protein [Lacrimispora sp.]|uniref:DUF262 domain-containing protein n=1 Tax=Lacrimispora sp. TaxID=2719234 RepID=UPI0032E4E8A7
MLNISEKSKHELDKLVNIGMKYRDGTISESLYNDVIYNLKNENEDKREYKKYLESNGIIINSGEDDIENMDEENEDLEKIKPYDTNKVDISPKPLSLDMLIARLENDEIDLLPDFQRKAGLWSDQQQSQLIESLLLRIPLPAFYFDGSNSEKWIVIDGLQRLTALKRFFVDKKLSLSGLEFLKELEKTNVDDMPRAYIRRMKETQIITYIINPGAPINLKYNIFKRINTGGIKLEPQEIRHALFQGRATKFLKRVADCEEFKEATSYAVKTDRMLDREFILRFVGFYELTVSEYKGSIELFLNSAMEYINKNYNDTYEKNVEELLKTTLKACYSIFGKFAFRRMPDLDKRRPISKALFETWTCVLARYPKEDLNILILNKDYLVKEYIKMNTEDIDFIDSIGSGKITAVRRRIEIIEKFVGRILNDRSYKNKEF